jgi:hypothetical protein
MKQNNEVIADQSMLLHGIYNYYLIFTSLKIYIKLMLKIFDALINIL